MLTYAYRVARLDLLTPHIFSFELYPLADPLPFRAGQYVLINGTFPCSVASAPEDSGAITFHLRTGPTWPASACLQQAWKQQTPLLLQGPLGSWHYDPQRPCLLLAGGTGITPFLSLLAGTLNLPCTWLYWGVRTFDDLYAQETLNHYHSLGLHWKPVLHSWTYEAALAELRPIAAYQVFVSGPLEMVEGAYQALTQAHLAPQDFYSDMR